MQNKLFAAIMTALLVLAMAGSAMCANEDVTVSIGDGEGNVTIPIMVENVTNLGSCHILLKYNKSVVSVTNATDGEMDDTFPNIKSDTGTVVIGAYQVGTGGLTGDVIVANITFTPVDGCSMDTSDLNLTVTSLCEETNTSHGKSIPHDIDDGVYTSGYTGGLNGDASRDGNVTMHDAMYIAKYATSVNGYTITCLAIADVDGSGNVDINDARYLANHLVETPGFDTLK